MIRELREFSRGPPSLSFSLLSSFCFCSPVDQIFSPAPLSLFLLRHVLYRELSCPARTEGPIGRAVADYAKYFNPRSLALPGYPISLRTHFNPSRIGKQAPRPGLVRLDGLRGDSRWIGSGVKIGQLSVNFSRGKRDRWPVGKPIGRSASFF